ncbi:MAG: signal transduction response regulator / Disease resistance protein [Actinomycetia bacterium]|nr:signal transduction response regulator / Disease resistance protein [Actinomycetes bacterium]
MSPQLRFGVLGPLAVWRDGELVTPRSASHRALLGALLLAEGASQSPERIAELVSPADPPRNARLWAQVGVSRLRSWLDGTGVAVEFGGGGYRIVLPPDSVDLAEFRHRHAAGDAAADPAERATLLAGALALWRGPVLADGPGGLREGGIAAALERQRLDAACALADAALACSRPELAVPVLDGLAREHPLDERITAAWALVLAGSGRQADALAAIEAARTRLAEELGVDPGEHLREAQLRVLRQEVLPPGPPGPPAAGGGWRGPRGQVTALIGRAEQEKDLAGLLARRRLVTVLGPGGCGKTTLALHVAAQVAPDFADGVTVLVATPFTSADEILMALGSLLSVSGRTAEQSRVALAHALENRRMLLVLDNCEHIAADCAAIVRWLLGCAPGLRVLATSRQPLTVPGEVAWPLGLLAVPPEDQPADPAAPSVALFLQRAREALPSFSVGDGELAEVGRLCRRLDGLPLALELAAARVRALTVAQIADRLSTGFGLLNTGSTGHEARHHTLRSTLDWSYELLDTAERTLLERMSVFRGGCTVEAAEAVCSGSPLGIEDILPVMVGLVDKSLVQPYDHDGGRRFRLLETVAEFAAERLAASGEAGATADRLLAYWLGRARVMDGRPSWNDRAAECRRAAPDIGNVRAALAHAYASGRDGDAAELTAKMVLLWLVNGAYVGEGEQRLRDAHTRLGDTGGSPEIRTMVRYWVTIVLQGLRDDYGATRQMLRAQLADLARHRPREHRLACVSLITHARYMLDPVAVERTAEMLDTVGDDDRDDEPSTALTAAGLVYALWGRYADAALTSARYAARAARRGTPFSASQHALRLDTALGLGDLAEAKARRDLLLAELDRFDDPAEREPARRAIADYELAAGRPEDARDFLAHAIADLRRYLPPAMAREAHLLLLLGEAQRRSGQHAEARQTLLQALSHGLGGTRFEAAFTAVLPVALLAADLGDPAGERLARDWDAIRRRLGLAVPPALRAAAGATFGLDPRGGTPSPDPGRWDPAELRALAESAHLWCAGDSAAVNRSTVDRTGERASGLQAG